MLSKWYFPVFSFKSKIRAKEKAKRIIDKIKDNRWFSKYTKKNIKDMFII